MMEPLFVRVQEYGKTSYELYKLKALEKTAGFLSTVASRTIVMLVFSMFLILVSIGLALWLGDALGKVYYGFFCVAGLYVFIGGVLFLFFRNRMKNAFNNSIVSHMLEKN